MNLCEYIEALNARPPFKDDNSEGAFWERYVNGGLTADEFCFIVGLVEVPTAL